MHNYVNVLFKWPPTVFSWGTLQHHHCLIKKHIKKSSSFVRWSCADSSYDQCILFLHPNSYIKCVEQAPRSLGLLNTHSHIAVIPFWEETLVQSLWTCISLMQACFLVCLFVCFSLTAAAVWIPTGMYGSRRKKQCCAKDACTTSNLTSN